jgi:hypothetical protein
LNTFETVWALLRRFREFLAQPGFQPETAVNLLIYDTSK